MSRVCAVVSGHVRRAFPAPLQGPAPSVRGVGGRGVLSGRVEVVLEGPDTAVAAVLAELDGPRAPGTVRRIDTRNEPERGGRGFTTA